MMLPNAACLAPLFALLLSAAPASAANKAETGDGVIYIIAVPFALVALGVVVHLARSIWMLSRPSKPPVHH